MATSREIFDTIQTYYDVSDSAYRNWGPDPELKGVYAIHMGYHEPDQEELDNHSAVKQMTRKLVEFANIQPGQRVLDAGCGTGSISLQIASIYPSTEVHGINIVPHQLQTANSVREQHRLKNAGFSRQDYLQTAFRSESFDRVVFCESFAHADDKFWLMNETFRLLMPRGIVSIADCFSYPGAEFTEEEQVHLKYFKIGMGVPDVVPFQDMSDWFKRIGFKSFEGIDITKNILPSALVGSLHAQMRIRQEENAQVEVTNGRRAIIGIEKLMSAKKVGYYFLSATK